MSTQLEQLSKVTVVVADTGDINAIKQYQPTDGTTNPSLLFAAAQQPEYEHLLNDAIAYGKSKSSSSSSTSSSPGSNSNTVDDHVLDMVLDKLAVNFGVEILSLVPGLVSTEVDARLSFDTEATVAKARKLIALYKEAGIEKDRVLIKIASTWEGIQAAKILEEEDIHVNMTLLFAMEQAVAAAEANATLISPFVGRILDWYKKAENKSGYEPAEDPGVVSVASIFNYYKKYGYKTVVMGASFRNKEEILELAGCDKLTIGPKFLEQLKQNTEPFQVKLDAKNSAAVDMPKLEMDEKQYRWGMNQNAMATEKLAEGIRNFAKDTDKLIAFIKEKM
jgi:transaldolase